MRIIAEIPSDYDNEYIVQISAKDIGALTGTSGHSYRLGSIIALSAVYKIVQGHKAAKQNLEHVARTLTALADLCMQQEPLLVLPEGPSSPTVLPTK